MIAEYILNDEDHRLEAYINVSNKVVIVAGPDECTDSDERFAFVLDCAEDIDWLISRLSHLKQLAFIES